MNTLSPTAARWSRIRWAGWILLVFVVQLGLIHALSLHRPIRFRKGTPSSMIISRGGEPSLEVWRALRDPTLLSLGGLEGFQSVWMICKPPPPLDARWKEEPAWLEVDRTRLGEEFRSFARTNLTALHGLVYKPAPLPSPLDAPVPVLPLRTASTYRVEGGLAGRGVESPPGVRSWPATDVLMPGEVQVSVDHLGRVVSAVLIPPGSGSLAADRFAVNEAMKTLFASRAHQSREHLDLGWIVFDWHAIPMTNAAAATP